MVGVMPLRILTTKPNPELMQLPWDTPLEEWGEKHVIQLPRGLSRHVVRFVRVGKHTCAVKETDELIARREYHLLRDLQRLGLPAVLPQGVVTGRVAADGDAIAAIEIIGERSDAITFACTQVSGDQRVIIYNRTSSRHHVEVPCPRRHE